MDDKIFTVSESSLELVANSWLLFRLNGFPLKSEMVPPDSFTMIIPAAISQYCKFYAKIFQLDPLPHRPNLMQRFPISYLVKLI